MSRSPFISVSRSALVATLLALGCASPAPLPPPKAAPAAAAPPPAPVAAPDPLAEAPTSVIRPSTPFPAITHKSLPGGLDLAIVPRRGFPVIELRLLVFSGQATDGKLPGVAAITGKLLKDGGAGAWSSRELAERTEALGARLAIGTDRDSTRIGLGVPTGELDQALEILAAVAEKPRFSPAEFEKLKQREIDRVKDRARTSPGWLASMVLYRELYELPVSIHPYARFDALPDEVASIKLGDVRAWYKEHFTPENAVLVVTGDVDAAAVEQAATRAFGAWRGKKPSPPSFTEPRGPNGKKLIVVDRPGSAQSQVFVGALGPERKSDEYPALKAADQILGGGVAGRLFLDVREKRSLAYSTSSWLEEPARGPMPLVLSAGTQTPKTADAVAALLEHYERMSSSAASNEELERAARFLSDSFAFKMETAGAIADLTSRLLVLGLPDDAYDDYRHAVRNLDAEDVARAASHAYRTGSLVVVVAGDADVVAKSLARFGPVEVLDPEHGFTIKKTLPHE
jgi:predicted Zn-dependent peptidase